MQVNDLAYFGFEPGFKATLSVNGTIRCALPLPLCIHGLIRCFLSYFPQQLFLHVYFSILQYLLGQSAMDSLGEGGRGGGRGGRENGRSDRWRDGGGKERRGRWEGRSEKK